MRDGVDRQRNPVLDADFTHQLGHVGFDSAFFNA